MKLTDYRQRAAVKALIYGPPKSGKTDLVGQLAEIKKLWWLDLEDGIKTLLHSPRMKKEWLDNIELIQIPDTQIYPIAVQTVLKIIKGGPVKICEAHGAANCPICMASKAPVIELDISKFTRDDVLVIDSCSQLTLSAMNYITFPHIQKDNYDYKPDWDDYAKQGRIMGRIFSIIQQADFNVVCISHEQLVEQEDGKKKLVPIGGTTEFSKTFAKHFDHVVYCDTVNRAHKAASSSTYSGSIVTGSRSGIELEKLAIPSLKELFK